MNTKLATSRMRTGQWADIIKDCKESGLKVDDYCASPLQKCLLLLSSKGKGNCHYAEWVYGSPTTRGGASCYPFPKLTASLNEIVLGINENPPMDLLANVKKVLRNS